MTDKATATSPSTTPAPEATSAADTTTTIPAQDAASTTTSAPADADADADAGDALFREYADRANKRLGQSDERAAKPIADPPPDPDDPDASASSNESQTGAKAPVSTSGAEKPDAAKAASDKALAEQQAAAANEPTDDDLLAEVPEALRDKLKGRLTAAQKRAAELETETKRLEHEVRSERGRARGQQLKAKEAGAPPAPDAQKTPPPEAQAEWDAFVRRFPDVAKGVKALFKLNGGNPDDSKELLQYVANQKAQTERADAVAAVEVAHPGWQRTAATPEFQTWLSTQSAKVQSWAESDDPEDAMLLFDRYGAGRPAPAGGAKDTTADPASAADSKAAAEAAALAKRRDAQQNGARSPQTRGGGAPNTQVDLNDQDQLFRFYADKANQRLSRSP